MRSRHILAFLIEAANELDVQGRISEADALTDVARRLAQITEAPPEADQNMYPKPQDPGFGVRVRQYIEAGWYGIMDAHLALREGGELNPDDQAEVLREIGDIEKWCASIKQSLGTPV